MDYEVLENNGSDAVVSEEDGQMDDESELSMTQRMSVESNEVFGRVNVEGMNTE